MIFFSIGLPGRFADWCDTAIGLLAGHLGGTVAVSVWPQLPDMFDYKLISSVLDEVALRLIGTSATHLVMGARQPDERLCAALAETNARFVVALDDPRFAAADILAATNAEARMVARAVANSCPLVMRYATLPGALTMHADRDRADPSTAIKAMARHFGVEVEDAAVKSIVEDLAAAGHDGALIRPDDDWTQRVPAAAHKMLSGALAGYREQLRGGDLGQIIWTRDLFIAADHAGNLTESLEASKGSPICPIIYGPYIHLPAGSWTARVVLGFSPEAAGHTFLVDAFSGRQLGSTSFQPERAGVYTVDINFSLDEPSGHGVEIRVWVWSDYARGKVAFGHVILRPLAMRQPDAVIGSPDDFRTVLDL
jgi:hypothetical protein